MNYSLIIPRYLTLFLAIVSFFPSVAGAATMDDLVQAAKLRTQINIHYSPEYYVLDYPNGDVPNHIGVCTDLIIRSYRAAFNFDLQEKVHEDIKGHFTHYPNFWGLNKPDSNIDHRRVPNLQTFFKRMGASLGVSQNAEDYQPGDLVTWNMRAPKSNMPHIGLVSNQRSQDNQRYLIIHNMGFGPQIQDMLFHYHITGHYRFNPAEAAESFS